MIRFTKTCSKIGNSRFGRLETYRNKLLIEKISNFSSAFRHDADISLLKLLQNRRKIKINTLLHWNMCLVEYFGYFCKNARNFSTVFQEAGCIYVSIEYKNKKKRFNGAVIKKTIPNELAKVKPSHGVTSLSQVFAQYFSLMLHTIVKPN